MIDDLLDFFDGNISVGQPWGVKDLDQHYPFKKNYSIHCGIPGSGKTDILLSMHFSQAVRNDKKCIAFLDEGSKRMHYLRLIGQWYGKRLFTIYPFREKAEWHVSRDEIIKGYEIVSNYIKIIDNENETLLKNKTISAVLNIMQSMIDREVPGTYQSVLIDPKNAFSADSSKGTNGWYEYDKVIFAEMREFQAKNEIKFDLVVHPTKKAFDNKHLAKDNEKVMGVSVVGYTKPIFLVDAENGPVVDARADDSMTFHRYKNLADIAQYTFAHVRKIKEEETGGKPTDEAQPIVIYKDSRTWRWMFNNMDLLGSVKASIKGEEVQAAQNSDDSLPF